MGVEVEVRDINKRPPPRDLLEKHVDEARFLDSVSTRSPVFKSRPLPRSKAEAIRLMLEEPNTIKRPVLVQGARAIFGFDKERYRELSSRRAMR